MHPRLPTTTGSKVSGMDIPLHLQGERPCSGKRRGRAKREESR